MADAVGNTFQIDMRGKSARKRENINDKSSNNSTMCWYNIGIAVDSIKKFIIVRVIIKYMLWNDCYMALFSWLERLGNSLLVVGEGGVAHNVFINLDWCLISKYAMLSIDFASIVIVFMLPPTMLDIFYTLSTPNRDSNHCGRCYHEWTTLRLLYRFPSSSPSQNQCH